MHNDSLLMASEESDDDPFEYGEVVRTLTSGRHSKLEGHLYGDTQLAGLSCHTKFVAAHKASDGYVSVHRGTWVVPPEGIPWNAMQVVRIISGGVDAQRKFVVILQNPLGRSSYIVSGENRHVPVEEKCASDMILHARARCPACLDISESEWWNTLCQPWYYVPLKKLRSMRLLQVGKEELPCVITLHGLANVAAL